MLVGAKAVPAPKNKMKRQDHVTAYLMVLPAVALLLIFVIAPLFMAVEKSFTDWNFYKSSVFVGLKNYRIILENEYFRAAVFNAFKFVLIIVPAQIVLSFLFAHVLAKMVRWAGTFTKMSIYVPTVIAGVVASVIFIFLLDYRAGLLQQIVMALGLPRQAFLADKKLATVSISVASIWLGFGYNALVMYAGLLDVPQEYYEAASIDGANGFVKMFRITIPCMKNIFVLLIIGLVTGTLQTFDLPYMMTNGGPESTTLTPMLYLYNNYRDLNKTMGYSIAGAILMMFLIAFINSFVFRIIRSEKVIDG